MLRLPSFNYIRPKTLKEATNILADLGSEAMIVAGGTDLYPKMKRGQFTPKYLISLKSLRELRGIRSTGNGGIWIGAGETLTMVSQEPTIQEKLPALSQAASLVSTPQLRNVGTIGGNVTVDTRCNYYDQTYFWREAAGFCLKKDGEICLVAPKSKICLAVFSSDTAPVLCSLDAKVTLVESYGKRTVPLEALYRDDGINYLTKNANEVLQGITIPRSSFDTRNVYLKLRRRGSFDFPVLGVAAALTFDNSTCRSAKIVLTAVASSPKVIVEASQILKGQKITKEIIKAAASAATRESHPVDNADMDYWYRKRMTKVYVSKAISILSGVDEDR